MTGSKNSNNTFKNSNYNNNYIDNRTAYNIISNNRGIDIIAELCPLILDKIYESTNENDYSLTTPFTETEKINFVNNKIIQFKDSLHNFWKHNLVIERLILDKNKRNSTFSGRVYGRFKSLYDDNKAKYKNEHNFGDLIIKFIMNEIIKQIGDFHDFGTLDVASDIHEGVRFLTFHAFYKCKILENPNDSK